MFCPKMSKSRPKIYILKFHQFYTQIAKLYHKFFFTNQVSGFFDHHYLWKKSLPQSLCMVIVTGNRQHPRLPLLIQYEQVCLAMSKLQSCQCCLLLVWDRWLDQILSRVKDLSNLQETEKFFLHCNKKSFKLQFKIQYCAIR